LLKDTFEYGQRMVTTEYTLSITFDFCFEKNGDGIPHSKINRKIYVIVTGTLDSW